MAAANLRVHISQFGDRGLILYWSRIRKKFNKPTENRQTEKAITEATLIPWIARLSGPILYHIVQYFNVL